MWRMPFRPQVSRRQSDKGLRATDVRGERPDVPRQRSGEVPGGPSAATDGPDAEQVGPRLHLMRPASDLLPAVESRGRGASIQVSACAALLATVVYLIWRTLGTLAGSTLWLSIPLLLLELHALVSDPQVALVQSPQEFYNDPSFEHIALRGGGVFADQEMFSSISR